jgi:hypothetical protein
MDDHKSFWDDISFHSYPDSFTYWGDSNYLCFARNRKQILQHDGTSRDSLQQQSEETTDSEGLQQDGTSRDSLQQQPKERTGSEGLQQDGTSRDSLQQQPKERTDSEGLQQDGTSRDSLQQQSEETTNSEEQAANDGTRNMSKVQPKDVESVGATTASKEVNTAVDMLSSLSIHAEPVPSNRIRPLRKKKLPNKYSDFLMQNHYH